MPEDYRAATIYLTFNFSPPSRSLMPNLRFIQLLTSGHDHMRHSPLFSATRDPASPPPQQHPVPAATCAGVSARAIAQYVALQVLSWAHQQPRALEVMARRRWVEPAGEGEGRRGGYPVASVLAGKRVGIWGYGNIGRQGEHYIPGREGTDGIYIHHPHTTWLTSTSLFSLSPHLQRLAYYTPWA